MVSMGSRVAPEEVGALRLGLVAVGDVAQDRQVPARDEPGRGAVLDVPHRSIGPDHSELPRLLGREKGLPGGIEPRSRLDELIEPLTEQFTAGHTEQTTGSGVRVDERPRIVDDEHGVAGGREECLRLWAAGHWIWLSRSRRRHGGRRSARRYFGVAGRQRADGSVSRGQRARPSRRSGMAVLSRERLSHRTQRGGGGGGGAGADGTHTHCHGWLIPSP
jgi:hypothetical protein